MADNIGGFKINGTVAGRPVRRCPDSVLGTPSTEIFNPAVAAAGLIITVALQVLKAIICCRQHIAAGLSVGTANPYYVRFVKMVHFLAYAMSQKPTFFSLWIGNNDVLGFATGGDGTDPLHLLQVVLVLMRHMICW
jgi:hypothetical protein